MAAACLVGVLLGALPAVAQEITPKGKGPDRYFAPPAAGAGEQSLSDPLARALYQQVVKLARDPANAPVPDARLTAVAATLADTLGADEVPGLELQEFLLAHYGLGDPLPELAMFQVGMSDEMIRNKFAGRLPQMLRGTPFGRIGIGVRRRGFFGRTSVVVALQRVEVELLPIPRRLAAGDSALIGGRLLRNRRDPTVLVAPPRGEVMALPVRGGGDSFRASFRCDAGLGRYQVEIMASGYDGKTVVANFPVYCGVEPPRGGPRGSATAETTDPKQAESLALAAINRDRATAGLPAVAWDDALARAARGYADELARRQVVEHVSHESGNAVDRIRRAGALAFVVHENVGRANSIADAQRSFMSSPGHRANILARGVTRVGVGVSVRKDGPAPTLYVTQLFAR